MHQPGYPIHNIDSEAYHFIAVKQNGLVIVVLEDNLERVGYRHELLSREIYQLDLVG